MDLDGKRVLVSAGEGMAGTALSIAGLAHELGAEIALAGPGAARAVVEGPGSTRPARVTLDFNAAEERERGRLAEALSEVWDGLEGALHVASAVPSSAAGYGDFAGAMQRAERAFIANAHALSAVARATLPLIRASGRGGSVVGASFTGAPADGRLGGIRSALEAVNRYVACELGPAGVRANVVLCGPLRSSMRASAATRAGGAQAFGERTPLGWDVTDPAPVARAACFLLSDWSRAVSGEVLHVDGGAHLSGR
ncbi:MAG: SDR family oxidoreductase [Thermoleophilaceae bacterium]|nr:SDR family oxidoreductase [Thermoleophilaceae bacterium]